MIRENVVDFSGYRKEEFDGCSDHASHRTPPADDLPSAIQDLIQRLRNWDLLDTRN